MLSLDNAERTARIADRITRDPIPDTIRHTRLDTLPRAGRPLGPDTDDRQIHSIGMESKQFWYVGRIVLTIRVHCNDEMAARSVETSCQGGTLSEAAA